MDCLLEVRNKTGDYPRPTPRTTSTKSDSSTVKADTKSMDLTNPYAYGGSHQQPKRRKTESLLDIWSARRIEKENARAPYAGQQTFGDVARLYLNMDMKGKTTDQTNS